MIRLTFAFALTFAFTPRAHAETVCDNARHPGLTDGPVTIGYADAELGTGHRACLRDEIGLGERAGAIIDTPGFYGALNADTLLTATHVFARRFELFGALELVHYQFAQNATLKGSSVGLGQLTVGGAFQALAGRAWAVTPYVRLELPTSSDAPDVRTVGGELGVAVDFRPYRKVMFHGYLGGDLTAGLSAAPSLVRGGAQADVGVQYSPATWIGLVLDLRLALGHRAALDWLAPAVAFRFRFWRTLGAERHQS